MDDKINKKKLSITMDTDVIEFFAEEAARDDRKFSSMVNKVCRDYMRAKKSERKDKGE